MNAISEPLPGQMLDDKVDELVQSLMGFQGEIEYGVNLRTAFVSVWISHGIDEICVWPSCHSDFS